MSELDDLLSKHSRCLNRKTWDGTPQSQADINAEMRLSPGIRLIMRASPEDIQADYESEVTNGAYSLLLEALRSINT